MTKTHDKAIRVGDDGKVVVSDLTPGSTVRVVVYQDGANGNVVDPRVFGDLPLKYERPFEPAIDPHEWDASS